MKHSAPSLALAFVDAIVRFGTNTQKSTEPAWQDVGANVLRMDTLYDATFHRWLKSEENVLTIAIHLQRISNEYPLDRIINALRWLVSSWRVESTAVIVRYVTADWATPQNLPPQPTSSPFRPDISRHASLLSDPGVLSGESRRGVLVRELTKDWTSQQIAQLVSILAVNLWCERPHLEAFIRTLVSDWDFCRLSSFFSYISNQLCLDYRVKVTMLQQAARRNVSRLSLKRARNAAKPAASVEVSASKSKAAADPENDNSDDGDNDTESNKRLRTDTSAADASEATEESSSSSLSQLRHDNSQASPMATEPSRAVPEPATVSDHSAADLSRASRLPTSPSAADVSCATATATATATAAASAASATIPSSSSTPSTAEHLSNPAAASSSSHSSTNISFNSATQAASPSDSVSCTLDSGAPMSLSVRAAQAGRMPAPLTQVSALSRASSVTAATSAAATTPSTPVVSSSLSSQPTAPPSAGCRTSELQTSVSTTDLTSIPYNTPLHAAAQGSRQLQLQHHRHQLGQATGSASAATGRRTRSRNNTGSAVTNASTSSLVSPATCNDRSSSSSSALLVRRPLTPQTVNSLFIVHADGYRHQSPDSPTLHLDHRYSRRYPQPLTPSRSSAALSMDSTIVSGGHSTSAAAAASSAAAASAAVVVVADSAVASTSVGNSSSHYSSSASIARQALRLHAASVSVSTATVESQALLTGSGSNMPQSQQLETEQRSHQPPQQHQQQTQQQQQQDFRGRTASESELGQFDGPASTHLSSLPLPSDSSANAANVCGRPSTTAHYDVLGIVIESEHSTI
ncbi:hypothetical protein EV179_003174 [Coemansia sp. RSA 487]|nr:hypothetical protein LPJ74_001845 [Coemansia sp. RSA 1843]KAJ2214272.1 hypothetical protein EV179_003174 [Coemansia sp. RSA 487]